MGESRLIFRLVLFVHFIGDAPNAAHGAYPAEKWARVGRSANLSTPPKE
jgi:hypothetical protein